MLGDYLEIDGLMELKLHFQTQGALIITAESYSLYCAHDVSYKENERLSLHSQTMNQQKDIIKELKLREEYNRSSKSHELTDYVQNKPPRKCELLGYFELTLTV